MVCALIRYALFYLFGGKATDRMHHHLPDNFHKYIACINSGKDLDAVLKATPILPEREARIILVQVFQGLVYLNKRTQKIIHYDLKPGNVLFDELGVAKVTDFGLSKVVENDVGSQGMELTSQGAGTYW